MIPPKIFLNYTHIPFYIRECTCNVERGDNVIFFNTKRTFVYDFKERGMSV